MKDYHNFYFKCNVLFLADVIEKFRNTSFKNHGLCPSHYLSAPGSSWDEMLKITKNKFELISDLDMFIFFEKVEEVEFLIFSIDIANATINI